MTLPASPVPPPAPVAPWFADARFGMFIHWGAYSVLGHGEQPLFRELLNPSEYRLLAHRFLAEDYAPRQWAALARQARMRYMVLTAKHHDGFCLFNTRTTDYNAVKLGPKRDLIAEYVEACREAGLRVGLYFSIPDWTVPAYFRGAEADPSGWQAFVDMFHAQVDELCANYGQIDLLWFDNSNKILGAEAAQSVRLAKAIRARQPGIVINNRLPAPAEGADWGYDTPEQRVGAASNAPWETCMTSTRKFWGWHVCHQDPTLWRTERETLEAFVQTVANGGNFLYNVGPLASGALPPLFESRARFLGDWIARNEEAVYGVHGTDFEFTYGGAIAVKGRDLFLYFFYWPGASFSVPGFKQRLLSASFVDGGHPVRATQHPHRIVLHDLPRQAPGLCAVVKLTFDAPPEAADWAKRRLWSGDSRGLDEWAAL